MSLTAASNKDRGNPLVFKLLLLGFKLLLLGFGLLLLGFKLLYLVLELLYHRSETVEEFG